MNRQVLYELATMRVISVGYCEFPHDPITHAMVENETFIFEPACRTTDTGEEVFWFYDEENDTFTDSAP